MGRIKKGAEGLPFRVTYEIDDYGDYHIEAVEGEIPENPLEGIPQALLAEAMRRGLEGDQYERWQAITPWGKAEWAKLGRTEVILEQVRSAVREREIAAQPESEELPDGKFTKNTINTDRDINEPVRGYARTISGQGPVRVMEKPDRNLVVCLNPVQMERPRKVMADVWKEAWAIPATDYEQWVERLAGGQSNFDREQVEKQFFRERVARVEAARSDPAEPKRQIPPDINASETKVLEAINSSKELQELRDEAGSCLVRNDPEDQWTIFELKWQEQLLKLRYSEPEKQRVEKPEPESERERARDEGLER
ncbi:MAG: hypothetical protein ABL901_10100 [Hyphomicrobiaceae bacterium]